MVDLDEYGQIEEWEVTVEKIYDRLCAHVDNVLVPLHGTFWQNDWWYEVIGLLQGENGLGSIIRVKKRLFTGDSVIPIAARGGVTTLAGKRSAPKRQTPKEETVREFLGRGGAITKLDSVTAPGAICFEEGTEEYRW